jgi:hypothetical protein
METSIVDAAGQSAAVSTKAKKPAAEIFGDVLATFLARIGAPGDGADGAEATFVRATARAAQRTQAPEEAAEPGPRKERLEREVPPPVAGAALEQAPEARHVRAATGQDGGDDAPERFHPDATAAPRVPPSPAEPGAAARVPNAAPAKDAPAIPVPPPLAAAASGGGAATMPGHGASPPIQVTVAQAPVHAQAALVAARTAVAAQDQAADPPKPVPQATAAPVAAAAIAGASGKGGAETGGGADPKLGQPGFAGLPPGMVPASAAGGQAAGAAATTAAFANLLDDGTGEPAGERILSLGMTPGTAVATAAARRAGPPPGAAQLARLTPMEQIAIHIQKALAAGRDQVTIRLRPEELGRIDVRLDMGPDGKVAVQVRAEKPETLELLQRDARGLERALQDAGLRPDSGALSFGLRGENGASGRWAETRAAPPPAAIDLSAEDAAVPTAAPPTGDGRVDLHV